jgi:hypothetical protein
MDVRCLNCGQGFETESDSSYRCAHCGWERKPATAPEPPPRGQSFGAGCVVGCLLGAVLIVVGLFLFLAWAAASIPTGI